MHYNNNLNQSNGIFQKTSEFWTYQLNNEIYLKKYPNVVRGSKKYFERKTEVYVLFFQNDFFFKR
ncbi:hypothetical protein MTBBW1_900012 [Desulfamplus magnetovallimortis]|uniref:Uncharacterized protein n=1 Tax=Desulfamplus magnetovallimortis TaxID=1246637 RepID=A0A1W1HL40_9BACT|nr:hypothetical protein MTBBW1_900012 [Desulfamplus magnetovallimortis]